ncbi:hypothetical protein [Lysobacter sp. N42]|uniref:hypothetical protein n=1 Tax=Lysobacter sp. N42 TaxID=2545719 RepID=UPI001404A44D|nr:hypothetical protein [Lysobacter sp. N42]
MRRSRTAAAVLAVGLVLGAAFAAQAWAGARGHSLGGVGLLAFAALAGLAWSLLRRRG